jgi:hypothetical protein
MSRLLQAFGLLLLLHFREGFSFCTVVPDAIV